MKRQLTKLCAASAILFTLGCESKTEKVEPAPTQTAAQEIEAPAEPALIGSDLASLGEDGLAAIAKSGDPAQIRSYLVYSSLRRGLISKDEADAIDAIVLDAGEGKKREIDHGVEVGLGRMRGMVMGLSTTIHEAAKPCDSGCKNELISKLFLPITKKPLLSAEGKADSEALSTLIDAMRISGDDKILGLDAPVVYKALRPSIKDLALGLKAIKAMGKDEALKQYQAALKEHGQGEPGQVNREMIKFYKLFPNLNELPQKVGVVASRRFSTVTGFWLRRMADGTDKILEKELMKFIESYDKMLFEELTK